MGLIAVLLLLCAIIAFSASALTTSGAPRWTSVGLALVAAALLLGALPGAGLP